MRRFFIDEGNVGAGTVTVTDRDDIHHMARVLRLKEGDTIGLSDGHRWEYEAVIEKLSDDVCEARIVDKQSFSREPGVRLTLFQGIPKQGKMETIVQKATELGACRIVPVFMDRTVVSDKGNTQKKLARWQRVCEEAAKQCRRGIVPEVAGSVDSDGMTRMFEEYDMIVFPYENEEDITIKDVLRSDEAAKAHDICVVIGPEGGFSEREADKIKEAGGLPVSLGKTILRTETAGIAAVSMIMYELEL